MAAPHTPDPQRIERQLGLFRRSAVRTSLGAGIVVTGLWHTIACNADAFVEQLARELGMVERIGYGWTPFRFALSRIASIRLGLGRLVAAGKPLARRHARLAAAADALLLARLSRT